MTDDLVTWLRAQLDEDEDRARSARPDFFTFEVLGTFAAVGDARHTITHSPARVLAEVDAKRRVVDRCAQAYREQGIYGEDGQEQVAEDILSVLVLPYADRPGYRPEWSPDT